MNSRITSKLMRPGRVLVALTLALATLVLLLSVWGGLPTADARESAADKPGSQDLSLSSTTLAGSTIFLPMIHKSDIVFFDDFSDPRSGWPHQKSYEDCYYEYSNGRYRVEVNDYGQRCIIPNFSVPEQTNGTFSVKVRRKSNEEDHLLYGLVFGAGADATEDRWTLEVYPNKDPACSNKPFYWLYALVDGNRKYFTDRCTDVIKTNKDDWNELKIIRNGKTIKVYLNGESKGEYNDANHLLDKGYTLLEVVSVSNNDITVEFDDFKISRNTAP